MDLAFKVEDGRKIQYTRNRWNWKRKERKRNGNGKDDINIKSKLHTSTFLATIIVRVEIAL